MCVCCSVFDTRCAQLGLVESASKSFDLEWLVFPQSGSKKGAVTLARPGHHGYRHDVGLDNIDMTVAPAFWSALQNFGVVQVEWRQVVEEPQAEKGGKLGSEVK